MSVIVGLPLLFLACRCLYEDGIEFRNKYTQRAACSLDHCHVACPEVAITPRYVEDKTSNDKIDITSSHISISQKLLLLAICGLAFLHARCQMGF